MGIIVTFEESKLLIDKYSSCIVDVTPINSMYLLLGACEINKLLFSKLFI